MAKIVRVVEVATLAGRWEREKAGGWEVVQLVRLKIFEIEVQLCGAANPNG